MTGGSPAVFFSFFNETDFLLPSFSFPGAVLSLRTSGRAQRPQARREHLLKISLAPCPHPAPFLTLKGPGTIPVYDYLGTT